MRTSRPHRCPALQTTIEAHNDRPDQFERFNVVRMSDGAVVLDGTWSQVAAQLPDSRANKQKLQVVNDTAHALRRVIHDSGAALRKAEAQRAQRKADDADADHALAEMGRRVTELEMQIAKLDPILQAFAAQQQQQQQNDMPPPPGEAMADDGDLEVKGPTTNEADPDIDTDGEALRLKAPVSVDDGEEFPDPELPKAPVTAQPIAVGLDARSKIRWRL